MDFDIPTKEPKNGLYCHLLLVEGIITLRRLFDKFHPPAYLPEHLNHSVTILKSLRSRKIINTVHWNVLYPPSSSPVTSETFEMTLLMILLRTICNISARSTGWNSLPPDLDRSVAANIVRVKYYRNRVLHASPTQMSIDDTTFNYLWREISRSLIELGADATAINDSFLVIVFQIITIFISIISLA